MCSNFNHPSECPAGSRCILVCEVRSWSCPKVALDCFRVALWSLPVGGIPSAPLIVLCMLSYSYTTKTALSLHLCFLLHLSCTCARKEAATTKGPSLNLHVITSNVASLSPLYSVGLAWARRWQQCACKFTLKAPYLIIEGNMNNQLVLRASICLSTLHLSHTPTVYRILCVCLSGIMSRYNKTVLKPCSILAFHSAHLTRCQPHGTARWTGFDFNLDVWVAIKVMIIKCPSYLMSTHWS